MRIKWFDDFGIIIDLRVSGGCCGRPTVKIEECPLACALYASRESDPSWIHCLYWLSDDMPIGGMTGTSGLS